MAQPPVHAPKFHRRTTFSFFDYEHAQELLLPLALTLASSAKGY
jgi:hypothetical protein